MVKTRLSLLLLAGLMLTACHISSDSELNGKVQTVNFINSEITYPQAEYDRARIVLMHEPGAEIMLGTLHPDAALFKCYLDADSAIAEHQNYQQILRNQGVEVKTLKEMLLSGCVDANNHWIEGPATDALRELTSQSITFSVEGNLNADEVEVYKQKMLKQYTPNEILRILLLQPEIKLKKTDINTGVEAEYKLNPLMNTFFMRDQMISTSKGLVIGKMNSSQRRRECDLVEFALNRIGRTPIYRIQGEDAFLEGGDFIPMRDYAMIGCGLRTTQAAIQQLMDNDLLGKDTLVVVNDAWKSQIQMHLDTYCNVIDEDLFTMCNNRVTAQPGDKDFLTVDVYARKGTEPYKRVIEKQSFLDFLASRGVEIIPILPEDEERFGNNFICLQGREIVMVAGQSETLKKQLADKGVKVHWAPLYNLTCGYGAAHCMTQMIGRSCVTDK